MRLTVTQDMFLNAFKDKEVKFTKAGLQMIYDYITSTEDPSEEYEFNTESVQKMFAESTIEELIEDNFIHKDVADLREAIRCLEHDTIVLGVTDNNTIVHHAY